MMTAGGLSAKQMRELAKAENAAAREHTAMMYRAAGYADYQGALRRDAERRRGRNAQRRTRRAA